MVSCIVQTIAVILGNVATILTFVVYGLPYWRVAIIAESSSYGRRIDGHWLGRWDGLWMTCSRQNNLPMSCQPYSNIVGSMTPDIKVSRILMSFAVMAAILGSVNSLIGMLFSNFCTISERSRSCCLLLAGINFIMAGILVLAPSLLIAFNIMKNVCFSECKIIQREEIGEAVMLAWPTVMLFFIGGSIFCWYHPCRCSGERCLCPSEDIQPDMCQEKNHLTEELHVLKPIQEEIII
ncbi:claudin-8-like [Anomaloglossus baeobatrachus]|uniref:claudin-8-like n=1 Tax=Anomaloglossus baeobatrachus TaxID=238106 RepID=UPI003F5030D1